MPRRSKNDAANAADTAVENHVAGRVRLRRALLGMSQSDLARALGITFQQVQKYERGSNRISVGKLYRLADILGVPLMFFFDGLAELVGAASQQGEAVEQSGILSRRELDLLRAWRNAPPEVADNVSALLRAIEPDRLTDAVPILEALRVQPVIEEVAPVLAESEPVAGLPRRRGRPVGSVNKAKPEANEAPTLTLKAPEQVKRWRALGAAWDPADIRDYDSER